MKIIDTPGWHSIKFTQNTALTNHRIKKKRKFTYMIENKGLHSKMMNQTMQSVHLSDLILFMVDGREGITKDDRVLIQNLNQKYNLVNHRVKKGN